MTTLNALEAFGSLPLSGGYLNQPITLIRDIQAARDVLLERRRKTAEATAILRAATEKSSAPNIPLPPIPKELLNGGTK